MKIYKLSLGGEGIPRLLNVLPIKYTQCGEWNLGFIAYKLTMKGITRYYLINSAIGIISLPVVPEIDYSGVINNEEFFNIFLKNINKGDLNTDIKSTVIELDYLISDKERKKITKNLNLDDGDKIIFLE